MHNRTWSVIISLGCAAFLLAACAAIVEGKFGPIYRVDDTTEPLVEKTIQVVETTGSPIDRAEIRGYIADWIAEDKGIREFLVLKDGRTFMPKAGPGWRPFGWSGHDPLPRIESEPPHEARAKQIALEISQPRIAELDPKYRSVEPIVYEYVVRLYRSDNSHMDVLVDPSGAEWREFRIVDYVDLEKILDRRTNRSTRQLPARSG